MPTLLEIRTGLATTLGARGCAGRCCRSPGGMVDPPWPHHHGRGGRRLGDGSRVGVPRRPPDGIAVGVPHHSPGLRGALRAGPAAGGRSDGGRNPARRHLRGDHVHHRPGRRRRTDPPPDDRRSRLRSGGEPPRRRTRTTSSMGRTCAARCCHLWRSWSSSRRCSALPRPSRLPGRAASRSWWTSTIGGHDQSILDSRCLRRGAGAALPRRWPGRHRYRPDPQRRRGARAGLRRRSVGPARHGQVLRRARPDGPASRWNRWWTTRSPSPTTCASGSTSRRSTSSAAPGEPHSASWPFSASREVSCVRGHWPDGRPVRDRQADVRREPH